MRVALVAGCLAALLSCPAGAEPKHVLETEYRPLVYSKGGVVDSCGVHFSVITSDAMLFQGSVNVWTVEGRLPAMLLKLAAVRAQSGAVTRLKVNGAWLKTATADTRTGGFNVYPSDDGMSFFAGSPELVKLAPLIFEVAEGALLGASIDGEGSDHTMRMKPVKEPSVVHQVGECLEELMADVSRR